MPANRLFMLSSLPAGPAGMWRPLLPAAAKHQLVMRRNARDRLWRSEPREPVAPPRLTGSGRDHRLQRLESVLFLSREPLTTRKLSQYANLADGTEARTLIRRLNDLYDCSGRAFRVERVAGGYQLLTRPPFSGWVRRLEYVPHETRLSAPALETLAVIAYRQPVLRADIEAIRGVNCGELLRQLMERDLVRIGGRSDDLGRPYLYATTRQFLRTFGLNSLEDLPRVETLPAGRDAVSDDPGPAGCRPAASGEENAAHEEEESRMPLVTLSGLECDEVRGPLPQNEFVPPQITAYDEKDEEDDNYDEFYDEDDADEEEEEEEEVEAEEEGPPEVPADAQEEVEGEEEIEEVDEEDEDEEEFEDEDEWEEVDDEEDSDWDDEDSDWDDDLDEEEEEEDEEWD